MYGNTGFLQAMTTVTNKIISKVYGKEDYAFQLMYMPMNSKPFYNDNYAEVIGTIMPLIIYAVANLASRTITLTSDINEDRIQQLLQRLGMRKSVELGLEYLLSFFFSAFFLPLVTLIGCRLILTTTDFWFLFVNILIYSLNVTMMSHAIKFLIRSHVYAEIVELLAEGIQIMITIYGLLMTTIEPWYVYYSSTLLPLPAITWVIRLGQIAFNRGIEVKLFQRNPIVNGNDLTLVMYYALLSLYLKLMIMIYLWPVEIANDPKNLRTRFYLCSPRFWRGVCRCGRPQNYRSATELDESVLDHAFGHTDINELLSGEANGEDMLKLHEVTVKHGKHNIVDKLSLTVKKGEIFVITGKNGSGKTTVLQTIAGLSHVHSGTATAFGIDLFKSLRFTTDNFLSYKLQEEALIDTFTPEEQIRFACKFMGLTHLDIEATVLKTLTEYDL